MSDLILLVDDDEELLDTLCFLFKEVGYRVSMARNRIEMLSLLKSESPDLIFLDINLGEDNGLELVLEIREKNTTPIIMLSGKRQVNDKVAGFELGADDYITKPYNTTELLARTKAALRRSKMDANSKEMKAGKIAKFDGWTCDIRKRTLISANEEQVKLTPGEFSLLLVFLLSQNEIVSRKQLLNSIGLDENIDRSIDVQILRLRKKLKQSDKSKHPIKSVRSVGYTFLPKVQWILSD